jgi:hypothetical protein
MSNEIVRFASMPDTVRISDVGIEFISDISFDDWARLMSTLSRLETAFQFALGDALNYGSTAYGEKYSQAMESTGHSYQALANYAWVARSVPHSNRVPGLSWTHHRVVARLESNEQTSWLNAAQAAQMTIDDLTGAIRGQPVTPRVQELIKVPEGMTPKDAERILKNHKECNAEVTLCEGCPYR